ncbi:hypothetical protein ABPG72_017738 [Tetrahymena utriculariae]
MAISVQTQSLDGNPMYMSPEVFKQEKPYSIKADVFSIGTLLTEVLLQRRLEGTEWIDLKTQNLFQIIPELCFSQNSNKSKFAYEILANMVNPDKTLRLEPITLLQKIQQFTLNEDSLKSLKVKQEQELKSIDFSRKKDITNNIDLSNYQKVNLYYEKSFEKAHLKTIFGIENVIQAITIISKYKNIVSLYLVLEQFLFIITLIDFNKKIMEEMQNVYLRHPTNN